MLKTVINIDQVISLLDNEKCTFYWGKSNSQAEISKDEIKLMTPKEVNNLIKNNLIAHIRR